MHAQRNTVPYLQIPELEGRSQQGLLAPRTHGVDDGLRFESRLRIDGIASLADELLHGDAAEQCLALSR